VSFCSKNPQLQSLTIRQPTFSHDIFSRFLPFCHNLRELNVSMNAWFTDECIESLVGAAPKLRSLDLMDTGIRSLQAVKCLLESYPSLEYLSISGCRLSLEATKYYLRESCVPRLRSNDAELQRQGLSEILGCLQACLDDILEESFKEEITSLNLISLCFGFLRSDDKVRSPASL
jgi:hypothetical protein